jgi:hypothetical protein
VYLAGAIMRKGQLAQKGIFKRNQTIKATVLVQFLQFTIAAKLMVYCVEQKNESIEGDTIAFVPSDSFQTVFVLNTGSLCISAVWRRKGRGSQGRCAYVDPETLLKIGLFCTQFQLRPNDIYAIVSVFIKIYHWL